MTGRDNDLEISALLVITNSVKTLKETRNTICFFQSADECRAVDVLGDKSAKDRVRASPSSAASSEMSSRTRQSSQVRRFPAKTWRHSAAGRLRAQRTNQRRRFSRLGSSLRQFRQRSSSVGSYRGCSIAGAGRRTGRCGAACDWSTFPAIFLRPAVPAAATGGGRGDR